MAEFPDYVDADKINRYVMVTGSDEVIAKYMLKLYEGDLDFAVSQYFEGNAPSPCEAFSSFENEYSQHDPPDFNTEIEFVSLLGRGNPLDDTAYKEDNSNSQLPTKSTEREDKIVDLVFTPGESQQAACEKTIDEKPVGDSSDKPVEDYLYAFNGNFEKAVSTLLDMGDRNPAAQQYLAAFSGNVFLAMHELTEVGNNKIRRERNTDSPTDIYQEATDYLGHLGNDLNKAINTLLELRNPEAHGVNGEERRRECESAERYLESLQNDFDLAFNVLLQVHTPDHDIDILPENELAENVNIEKERTKSFSNAAMFAGEYLQAFNGDSERAVNALLQARDQKYLSDLTDEKISDEQKSAAMYLDSFFGNYSHALSTLLDMAGEENLGDRQNRFECVQHHCPCGNEDVLNTKQYFYQQNGNYETQFIGILCMRCDHEYLIDEVLKPNHDKDVNKHKRFELFNCRLHRNTLSTRREGKGVEYTQSPVLDLSLLKRGDQFALDRLLYKHGIVNEVDVLAKQIEGIHYQKRDGRATIVKETLHLSDDVALYKINYDESKGFLDHTKLVIARACSAIGDQGYHLFYDNCEHFSTFCKTGVRQSHQSDNAFDWLKKRINQLLTGNNLKAAYKLLYPKGRNGVLSSSKSVRAGIMFVIKGKAVIMEINELQSRRNDGDVSYVEYVESLFSCLVGGIIDVTVQVGMSGMGNLGACIGQVISPDGTFNRNGTAMFIGRIICGKVGGLASQTLGNIVASFFGNLLIRKLILYDDRAVGDLNDLQVGDHIVFHAGYHHPRCHGIVTGHNGVSHLRVIRSDYKEGVIEEERKFVIPLFKVVYGDDECAARDKTIRRAKGKLGTNEYNLITFNCKHFAQWCKKK